MKFRDVLSRSRRLRTEKLQAKKESTSENDAEKLVFAASSKKLVPSMGQWRYLPALMDRREKLFLWLSIALVVAGSLFFAWRRYEQSTIVVPEYGGSYTEGVVGTPQYINPLLAPLSDVDSDLSSLIFPSLVKRNDKMETENDLITNYVVSDDELTYTFFMRSDAKWDNSDERVDADDVIFTIKAIQDATYQSPLKASMDGVVAEKIDDFSFSLKLKEKYAPFVSTLTFGILPEHLWYNVPGQNVRLNGLNLQPVGAGPYKFKELSKDEAGNVKSFTVQRNENYYGSKPYIDEIQFLFYLDATSAIDALKSNRVEGLSFVPKDRKAEIQNENGDIEFHSLRIPQYSAVFFNLRDNKALQSNTVREALAHAVDRDKIIDEVLGGEASAIYSPILPGYLGYNADVKKNEFSLEKSREILRTNGWRYPKGKDDEAPAENATASDEDFVPREKDGVKLEFTLKTVDLPEYQDTAVRLAQNWKEVGVKVNVETFSAQDIQSEVIKDRKYDALLFGQIIGADPDPYPFWHSSQQEYPGLALSVAYSKDMDELIEKARKTSKGEARAKLYTQFQDILANELPAIFLYNPLYTYAVNEKVQGIRPDQYIAVPADRFSGVHEWYVETHRQHK